MAKNKIKQRQRTGEAIVYVQDESQMVDTHIGTNGLMELSEILASTSYYNDIPQ